jgi:hypothetical protein
MLSIPVWDCIGLHVGIPMVKTEENKERTKYDRMQYAHSSISTTSSSSSITGNIRNIIVSMVPVYTMTHAASG